MEKYKKPDSHYFKIFIKSIAIKESGCWEWIKAKTPAGYGASCYNGVQVGAHVLSKILFGEYEPRLHADHICKNRCCVNPDHLRMVSPHENVYGGNSDNPAAINKRKIACHNGHVFNETNTKYYNRNGKISRRCISCLKDKSKRWREKKKATH